MGEVSGEGGVSGAVELPSDATAVVGKDRSELQTTWSSWRLLCVVSRTERGAAALVDCITRATLSALPTRTVSERLWCECRQLLQRFILVESKYTREKERSSIDFSDREHCSNFQASNLSVVPNKWIVVKFRSVETGLGASATTSITLVHYTPVVPGTAPSPPVHHPRASIKLSPRAG